MAARPGGILGALALLAACLMALAACGGSDDSGEGGRGGPLQGTWALTRYLAADGTLGALRGPLRTEITFARGVVTGVAAVNTYRGPFQADGAEGVLSAGPLATTQIGGPPEALAAEADYLRALESVASYTSDDVTLTMYDDEGTSVLTYERDDPAIAGAWEVTGYNNGRQAVVSLVGGSTVTAAFGEDLTLTGDSGVSTYRTTYATTEGAAGESEIAVAPAAATRKAGPPELMEQERLFLRALESAATYTIQADRLVLRDASDEIAVTLTRT